MFLGRLEKEKSNMPNLGVNNPFLQNQNGNIKYEKNPFLSNSAIVLSEANNKPLVNNKPHKASANHIVNVAVNNKLRRASESHITNAVVFIRNPFLQSSFNTHDISKEVQINSPHINKIAENDKISVVPSEINSNFDTDKTKSELSKYLQSIYK